MARQHPSNKAVSNQLEKLFLHALGDIYSAEKAAIKALENLADAATLGLLRSALSTTMVRPFEAALSQAEANLAAAHEGAGQVDEALALYVQAIDQFGELGERENRAACFKKLSGLQVKKGQQMQALASMQAGLNLSSELSAKEKTLKGVLNQAMKMIGPK